MKKLPIILLSVILAAACLLALVLWVGRDQPQTQPTAPGQSAPASAPVSQISKETTPSVSTMPTPPPAPPAPPVAPPDESKLTARHVFVYDETAGQVLYTYGDQNETIAPASLTKLFTAYVALQYLKPETVISVGEEAGWIEEDSSRAAVAPGCRLSVELVVQGMLMQSGNDAAYALAVAAGRAIEENPALAARPALDAFVKEMNDQAQALGLTGTHFANPDGYTHDQHYTTCADLLAITKLAMQQPMILRYCGMAEAVVIFESGEEYTWKNSNLMLHADSEYFCLDATGLKTGSTKQAGMCLIASFDTGEKTLIIGVLGCEERHQRFEDALMLLEHYR